MFSVHRENFKSSSTTSKTATVDLQRSFPLFVEMEVWVVAQNQQGETESDRIKQETAQSFGELVVIWDRHKRWLPLEANRINTNVFQWCWLIFCDCLTVKTIPPSNITPTSEDVPTALKLTWTRPDKYMTFDYEIRFCAKGSTSWSNASTFMSHWKICNLIKTSCVKRVLGVPQVSPPGPNQSFELRNLQADTVYIIQIRCRYCNGCLHWSDWSPNVTKRTPEDGEFWDQTTWLNVPGIYKTYWTNLEYIEWT